MYRYAPYDQLTSFTAESTTRIAHHNYPIGAPAGSRETAGSLIPDVRGELDALKTHMITIYP